jgi:nucleoid-associated protein YgaU
MGKYGKPKGGWSLNNKLACTVAVATGAAGTIIATGGSAEASTLTASQVAQYAKQGCPSLSAAQVNMAVKIAFAESRWNTDAHNANGEDSRGLWQINVNPAVRANSWGNLYNPAVNAKAMCDVSDAGSNWRPWATYLYGKYINAPGYLGPISSTPATPPVSTRPNTPPHVKPQIPYHTTRYTVVKGDTLYDIAKDHGYGAGKDNWKPLYQANKATVGSNPDLIFPGQQLGLRKSGGTTTPPPVHAPPAKASYVKPVNAPMTQGYGVHRAGYTLGYHTGADFSAASGTPVVAATNGTVVASDTSSAYGNNIQIKAADGRYLLYAHLSSKSVSVGQHVTVGQRIGAVGATGNASGPHLHFEVRTVPQFAAGNFLDPVAWLRSHGVAL